jgi:hypothetical protein
MSALGFSAESNKQQRIDVFSLCPRGDSFPPDGNTRKGSCLPNDLGANAKQHLLLVKGRDPMA